MTLLLPFHLLSFFICCTHIIMEQFHFEETFLPFIIIIIAITVIIITITIPEPEYMLLIRLNLDCKESVQFRTKLQLSKT